MAAVSQTTTDLSWLHRHDCVSVKNSHSKETRHGLAGLFSRFHWNVCLEGKNDASKIQIRQTNILDLECHSGSDFISIFFLISHATLSVGNVCLMVNNL